MRRPSKPDLTHECLEHVRALLFVSETRWSNAPRRTRAPSTATW